VATLAVAGILPGGAIVALVPMGLGAAVAVLVVRRRDSRRSLLVAGHVEAMARALRELERHGGTEVAVARTPAGLVISAGAPAAGMRHLGLSLGGEPLPADAAEAVGRIVGRLVSPDGDVVVAAGRGPVTHVIVRG
jgi:hypothetical protein